VGIVGAGRVGSYYARRLADSVQSVAVVDIDASAAAGLVADLAGRSATIQTAAVADLRHCDTVIEAVDEVWETKTALLAEIEDAVEESALLVTTTSAYCVSDLGRTLRCPQRLVGLHCLPTAAGTGLVELARGCDTTSPSADRARAVCAAMSLPHLPVPDRPGRITRRLLASWVNQVVRACDEGLADTATMDSVIRLGLGHSVGTVDALERAGVADHVRACRAMSVVIPDASLLPPPVLDFVRDSVGVAIATTRPRSGAEF
jgi:3-hydroxybutyryl-CoA dehydrogenase